MLYFGLTVTLLKLLRISQFKTSNGPLSHLQNKIQSSFGDLAPDSLPGPFPASSRSPIPRLHVVSHTSKHLFLCTFCNCSLKFITIFVSNPSSTKCYFRCAVILPSLQFLVISNSFFPDPSQHSAYSASPLTLTLTRPSTREPLSAAGSLLSARPPHMLLSLPGKPHTAPPSSS